MMDLSTTYLGLKLKNPLVASASPLSKKIETIRKLEEAGAAAIVLYSLFEEQIAYDSRSLSFFLDQGSESNPEATSYFPDLGHYNVGPEGYLEHIRKIKQSVHIPVIGSLNGVTDSGWIDYAKKIEDAGADALELNLYNIPTDLFLKAAELEEQYLEVIQRVRSAIQIPLAVKISPFFTSLPNFAHQAAEAGANGLVLFNRFYQPDLDIETLEAVPTLELSTSSDLRLPLRWVAILFGRVQIDLALTSGVHTSQDAIKAVMAGSSAVMMASELIHKGPARLGEILAEMTTWLETFEYTSIEQMQGSMSQRAVEDPSAFERGNYMKALSSFDHKLA
ncbi:MAG TPA: dihydroorotate dehydrogenase-like protein [Anaerolineaceae bacterium]